MKKHLTALLWSQIAILCVLALLSYPQSASVISSLWTIIIVLVTFVLPGYRVSLLFFDMGQVSRLERLLMSGALSLATIVFLAFYLHYLGIAVYPIHILILSSSIIALCRVYLALVHRRDRPRSTAHDE